MKRNLKILIAGLAIIIVSNVVALAGVAYNRSGEPDAVLELTERELGLLPYRYGMRKESTGLGLRFNCRIEDAIGTYGYANSNCLGNPGWFDREKLTELGFDILRLPADRHSWSRFHNTLPRKVYIVLEYDGESYQRVLVSAQTKLAEEEALLAANPGNAEFEKRAKRAREALESERYDNSRLFVVDAGLDSRDLRQRYADIGQYIIMQALVRPGSRYIDKVQVPGGVVTDLLVDTINIPLEHRALLTPLEAATQRRVRNSAGPRYTVRIAFGRRLEPWVIAVQGL